jgi:hypothetical protein
MPLPTSLTDLSLSEGSNYPLGTEPPAVLDNVQRQHAVFLAQLRDGVQVPLATAKTTLVDADIFPINDSAASNLIKKITWSNIKAALVGVFQPVGSYAASGANADITSLTALTAGGLPDNSVLTADIAALQVTGAKIAASTITADKLSGAQSGSAPVFGVRAWARFDGTLTGTNAPVAGGNVTSVTRNSLGNYTLNFTTAMASTNYTVSITQGLGTAYGTDDANLAHRIVTGGFATGSCNIAITNPAGTAYFDGKTVSVLVIG